MRFSIIAALSFVLSPVMFGELTVDQKLADFNQLAGLYAKHYAPYEWKRDVIGFDLLDLRPWLERVKQSKSDIDFYDICVRYVASLKDSHDEYTLPSDFRAYLHFDADIYDGAVLVQYIDRLYLSRTKYPFQVGDEVVSVDGVSAREWVDAHTAYAANGAGNPVTARRLSADLLTYRLQAIYPRAAEISDVASVVLRRANGDLESYDIEWDKRGTPFASPGTVPSPRVNRRAKPMIRARSARSRDDGASPADSPLAGNPWNVWTGAPADAVPELIPDYLRPLAELQTMQAAPGTFAFGGFGAVTPVFNPPQGFKQRLGGSRFDYFLSGTYVSGEKTIGFIRVPSMNPASSTLALQQFSTEIAYMQANTDGLVIDVMANGGGSLCYTENLLQYLFSVPFRSAAYEIRATQYWVQVFSSTLTSAKLFGAEQWIIDLYTAYLKQIQQAQSENRGRTGSLPICGPSFEDIQPAEDRNGQSLAYTKPILLLTDEFTLSAGETFGMILQDLGRAKVFGMRTDGGGGNPASYGVGAYSEGTTRVTRTFVTRPRPVATPGFPPSLYIENTGVYPDYLEDYMTLENLGNGGRKFVENFTQKILDLLPSN